MSELKPCPFCGGKMKTDVVTFDVEFYEPPYEQWYLEHIDLDAAADKRCPIPTTDTFYETEAEAIEAWNTRVERTCKKLPSLIDQTCIVRRNCQGSIFEMEFGYWRCSECQCENFDGAKRCMECGAKVIE